MHPEVGVIAQDGPSTERLIGKLRSATRARHEALDRKLDLTPQDVTLPRYVAFLRGSLAAVAPLEAAIARWLPSFETARAERLRRDLAALGAPETPAPPARWLPRTLPEAIGCAYVLEGSALGGQALAPIIERALATTATTYLRLRGPATAEAWRSFQRQLADFDATATDDDRTAACAAAGAAFEQYEEAFRASGVIARD